MLTKEELKNFPFIVIGLGAVLLFIGIFGLQHYFGSIEENNLSGFVKVHNHYGYSEINGNERTYTFAAQIDNDLVDEHLSGYSCILFFHQLNHCEVMVEKNPFYGWKEVESIIYGMIVDNYAQRLNKAYESLNDKSVNDGVWR